MIEGEIESIDPVDDALISTHVCVLIRLSARLMFTCWARCRLRVGHGVDYVLGRLSGTVSAGPR
jgi:hypothetical protein